MFKYCPNIYTGTLDDKCVEDAIQHARDEFPNEACGAIINGEYVKFKNESETPELSFEIKDDLFFVEYINKNVECLVHSHNDSNQASFVDQVQQKELDLPSLIINLKNKSLMDCIVFGEKELAPIEGRPFFWGAFDCVTCVSDYLINKFGVGIDYPPHEMGFWGKQKTYFESYIEGDDKFMWVSPDDLKVGDMLLYNIDGSRHINHIGVYVNENGQVLHHMYNNISGLYPINFNKKYLRKAWRLRND